VVLEARSSQQPYLWRAVGQDGDLIAILAQPRRDQRAAERFFRRPDQLRSYSAALRAVAHNTERYANNRAEVSHQTG